MLFRSFQPMALRNRLAAAQARAKCKQCQQTLDRGNFWPGDWHNRHKYGGLKCMTCEPREPGHRGTGAAKGVEGVLPESIRQYNEAKQAALDASLFACSKCLTEKSRGEFFPCDLNHRSSRALLCKVCRPTPPEERAAAKELEQFTCTGCTLVKLRGEFWSKDLPNPKYVGAKHKLLCKSCRPTPPGQRWHQYKCRSCELDKPREEFWQEDLDNRTSSRKLVCKGCRSGPPEPREPRERQYACSTCKVQKPRDDYWLEDFDNRAITKRLVCKVCRPTPPAQRQKHHHQNGQARSKSAGAVLSHANE